MSSAVEIPQSPDQSTSQSAPRALFKFMVGGAALFIAGCSAFFSVNGLGLLFVGSAVAVMIMAASLELGKLVAASFLYRYWSQISVSLRFYLTAAVLLLIAITSLGNYGYLARAYERTNSQIGLLEQQIASVQKEIDDTQQQIDGSKSRIGQLSTAGRQDIQQIQSRIDQANQSLDQNLKRLDERRKSSRDRRDRDVDLHKTRMQELADVLRKGLEGDQAIINGLNERVAVLDRAVDAYTAQGGPAFFKSDGIRKGQALRQEQQPERDKIAGQIAEHQGNQQKLRVDNTAASETVNREVAAVEDRYRKEVAALDSEEQSLRQARNTAVADAEKQLAALQSLGQTNASAGTNQIEGMYQRIRSGNDEIRRLREQIAATDIGSYRFVARAFNAPADDVVKWLILVLVLVFDPLAVALTVGFNMALMRDRKRAGTQSTGGMDRLTSSFLQAADSISSPTARPSVRWVKPAAIGLATVALLGGFAAGGWYGWRAYGHQGRSAHSRAIPADSFAVLTLRPAELEQSPLKSRAASSLVNMLGPAVANEMRTALHSGFDPAADVYMFLKYPADPAQASADRPAILCGLVARVTDPASAELSLSRLADALARKLAPTTPSPVAHSRSMVKFGRGRYLDPKGTFLTFALTEREAVVLVELEGNPARPALENEIRLCLAEPKTETYGKPAATLPPRALAAQGPATLWFNAGQCFSRMPRNAAAQARYQQLQKHLAFDLLLTLAPAGEDRLSLAADYHYDTDRFRAGSDEPTAIELLAKLGPSDQAGLAGQLMDRCASTLEFDSLIERLKTSLAGNNVAGTDMLVEKTIASDRQGRFVLTAHLTPAPAEARVASLKISE